MPDIVTITATNDIVATDQVTSVVDAGYSVPAYSSLPLSGGALTGPLAIGLTADAVGLTVKGASGGAADLQEWKNSAGTVLAKIGASGYLTAPGAALSESAPAGGVLTVTNSASGPSSASVLLYAQSAGDGVTGIRVTGDAASRLLIDANGKLSWGDGTNPRDVNLYRNAAGVLKTDNTLIAGILSSGLSSPVYPLDISSTGQSGNIKATAAANNVHALTVYQAGTGFDNTVALNVTSDSNLSSAMYISGAATQRGVLKINHTGQADGSDVTASAIAIDLGSVAGTACQGIALITTTPTTGNLILCRNNGRDDFVVKGAGTVGIGVAIGHTPAGMLEIAQKDTSTVGLQMTAIASGADMVNLKDSGGSQRFQIGNGGNMTVRATAFFTNPVMFGSASTDVGGGGGGVITLCHNTDPTTNPASGHIILYADVNGDLWARGSSGTTTRLAVH